MLLPKMKILLIDQDLYGMAYMKRELARYGFILLTAEDGVDAIEKAMIHNPEIILMDIPISKINGIEACVRLRRIEKFDNTIIAFLTQEPDDNYQVLCFEAGADDYIRKPIKTKVLVHRLNALYRRVS